MARTISNAKLIFGSLYEGIGLSRRGFSSSVSSLSSSLTKKLREEKSVLKNGTSDAALAWIPDPVTGYYRPANRLREIDPAELRRVLLKKKE